MNNEGFAIVGGFDPASENVKAEIRGLMCELGIDERQFPDVDTITVGSAWDMLAYLRVERGRREKATNGWR